MRLGNRSASLACLSLPYGKGYVFWTWPVLTPACLDTEYFRKSQDNVKNRTKFDTDFPIGQEREGICLKKDGGIPSVTGANFLSCARRRNSSRPMSLKDEHTSGWGAVSGSRYSATQLPIQAKARAMGPNGRGFNSSFQLWGSSASGAAYVGV